MIKNDNVLFERKNLLQTLLIAILLTLTCLPALANIIEVGDFKYSTNSDGTCMITGMATGHRPWGNLVIPEKVTYAGVEYTVSRIGYGAFKNCTGFNWSLTLPNTITAIESEAFSGCSGFTGNLSLPNSLERIEYSAFKGCSGFTGSLIIPGNVTKIGYSAFQGCSGFDGTLTISDGVQRIEREVFSDCSGFKGDLVLPNSLSSVGSSAFEKCSGFNGSLVLSNNIKSIESGTFAGCNGLTGTLTIPNGVETISSRAFLGCNGLTGELLIPNTVTSIGSSAFSGCSGFNGNLTIPDGIEIIDSSTFYNCSGLSGTLRIPESVKTIESNAFFGCKGFSGDLIIPNGVALLGGEENAIDKGGVFEGCSGFNGKLSLPENIKTIEKNTFRGCSGLTGSLNLPSGIVSILERAFDSCSSLTGILTLPDGLTFIGKSAFANCKGFTGSLIIPNSVESLGINAFASCSGFDGSLSLPEGLTDIAFGAFSECSNLTGTLSIPNSVTEIGDHAFENCKNLVGPLRIPESVTSIGSFAFSKCSGFTGSLKIPDGITIIENSTFSGCSGFTGSLTIPSSVTSIGSSAFNKCEGLAGTLTLGNQISSIGNNAFFSCGGLNGTLTLPASLEKLGNTPFTFCGFTEFVSLNTAPPGPINTSGTFNLFSYDNIQNAKVYVPSASVAAYEAAPGWKAMKPINAIVVACTGISVDHESLELKQTQTAQLTATVFPEDANDKTVIWTTSNSEVATVDENGIVTGVGIGEATITAKTVNDLSASCIVKILPWTKDGLEYVIIPGAGDGDPDVVNVTGGEPDGDGTLNIPEKINIDGQEYPVTEIGDGAFKDNTNIKKLVIPASVVKIGNEAFSGCTSLVEVVAEDGEKLLACGADAFRDAPIETLYLGRNTSGKPFAGNTALKDLTVGDKVTAIGSGDCSGCTGITSVKSLAANPPTLPDDGFEEPVYTKAILSVPEANKDDYKNADGWKKFFVIKGINEILPVKITLNETEIELAERGAVTLQATVTPEDATDKTVTWTTSDEAIATVDATGKVTGVKAGTVTITATTVAMSAEGKTLTASCEITVVPKTETVGGIKYEIVIGGGENGEDAVRVIGGEPDGDGTLDIPEKINIDGQEYPVTEIGDGAFKDNTNIKKLVIPASVLNIGGEAFSGCTSLIEVVAEDGEKLLACGADAFRDAPIAILYQGRNTSGTPFASDSSLDDLTFGKFVSEIGPYEFMGCRSITNVKSLADTPPALNEDAFDGPVYSSATLRVPEESVDAYKIASGWEKFYMILGLNEIPVMGIELDITEVELTEGETVTLKYTITPTDATNQNVSWLNLDPEVAVVDGNGVVTAIKTGTTAIVVRAANGLEAICDVTVVAKVIPAESITLSRHMAELKVNETLQLTATVAPENATDKTVVWESSDEAVVTVSEEGLLTAVGVGEATVTAKCGDITATCAVKVTAASGIYGITVEDGKPLAVYNLQGVRLKVSTLEELNRLPKGFYIVNGKKIYIK